MDTNDPFDWRLGKAGVEETIAEFLPKPGDRLISEEPPNLILDPVGGTLPGDTRSVFDRWGLYVDGYLAAADALVTICTSRAPRAPWGVPGYDSLLYPILFLYRHHLELRLKEVIRYAAKESPGPSHGLLALWDRARHVYSNADAWADGACAAACRSLICELDSIDPNSQAARYPYSVRGNQTLQKICAVNPSKLAGGVHKISNYLGTIIEAVAQDREWKAEMESW